MSLSTRQDDLGPLTGYESMCRATGDGEGIRELMNRVGDKWSLLIIGTLRSGRLRFGEIRHHIPGVSQRMLTLTLRNLERDGLLTRTAYAEIPPRVEYELTPIGKTLIGPATALAEWAITHQPAIAKARATFDERLAGSQESDAGESKPQRPPGAVGSGKY